MPSSFAEWTTMEQVAVVVQIKHANVVDDGSVQVMQPILVLALMDGAILPIPLKMVRLQRAIGVDEVAVYVRPTLARALK